MGGRLQDKVAIVTGCGSVGPGWGNGKAMAVLFAREGAKWDRRFMDFFTFDNGSDPLGSHYMLDRGSLLIRKPVVALERCGEWRVPHAVRRALRQPDGAIGHLGFEADHVAGRVFGG